jgi:hypothetical protein
MNTELLFIVCYVSLRIKLRSYTIIRVSLSQTQSEDSFVFVSFETVRFLRLCVLLFYVCRASTDTVIEMTVTQRLRCWDKKLLSAISWES